MSKPIKSIRNLFGRKKNKDEDDSIKAGKKAKKGIQITRIIPTMPKRDKRIPNSFAFTRQASKDIEKEQDENFIDVGSLSRSQYQEIPEQNPSQFQFQQLTWHQENRIPSTMKDFSREDDPNDLINNFYQNMCEERGDSQIFRLPETKERGKFIKIGGRKTGEPSVILSAHSEEDEVILNVLEHDKDIDVMNKMEEGKEEDDKEEEKKEELIEHGKQGEESKLDPAKSKLSESFGFSEHDGSENQGDDLQVEDKPEDSYGPYFLNKLSFSDGQQRSSTQARRMTLIQEKRLALKEKAQLDPSIKLPISIPENVLFDATKEALEQARAEQKKRVQEELPRYKLALVSLPCSQLVEEAQGTNSQVASESEEDSSNQVGVLHHYYTEIEQLLKPPVSCPSTLNRGPQILQFIEWQENSYRREANQSIDLPSGATIAQHCLTPEATLKEISDKIAHDVQSFSVKATCIALAGDSILIGNSAGELKIYDYKSEELTGMFCEKGWEFSEKGISVICVHPLKINFVIVGYVSGQVVLVDTNEPEKSVKIIRELHLGYAVAAVAFCELDTKTVQEEEPEEANPYEVNPYEQNPYAQVLAQEAKKNENLVEWKFVSVGEDGLVMACTAQKGFLKRPTKHTIVNQEFKCLSLASGFDCSSQSGKLTQNLIAVGSRENVFIFEVSTSNSTLLKQIPSPTYNNQLSQNLSFTECLPSLAFGTSTESSDAYPTLAIGWGPLVQVYSLSDRQKFKVIEDGWLLMKEKPKAVNDGPRRESVSQKRHEKVMKEINPYDQEVRYQAVKQAIQNKSSSSLLSPFECPEQFIERVTYLADSLILIITRSLEFRIVHTASLKYQGYNPEEATSQDDRAVVDDEMFLSNLAQSQRGLIYSQTFSSHDGNIIALGVQGSLYKFQHLSWADSIEVLKQDSEFGWADELIRARDIYCGSVKGFKDVPEGEEMRRQMLKGEIKMMLNCRVSEQLSSDDLFEAQNDQNPYSQERRPTALVLTLINLSIQICLELDDMFFLFEDLFQQFIDCDLEEAFLIQLKMFILAGKFSEFELPEDILTNYILSQFKNPDDPSLLEKVIVNLNLKSCPDEITEVLLAFSQEHSLSTALIYLYTEVKYEGNKAWLDLVSRIKGEVIENQQIQKYHGYKILWAIQKILDGKQIPLGKVQPADKFKDISADLMQCIASDQLNVLLEIDSGVVFRILSTIFLKQPVSNYVRNSHQTLLSQLENCHTVRTEFLFFILAVVQKSSVQVKSLNQYKLLLEIVSRSTDIIEFMKSGFNAPGVQELVEQLISEFIDQCEPLSPKQIDELIDQLGQFTLLKIKLLELKEDFSQALELHLLQSQDADMVFQWIDTKLTLFASKKTFDHRQSSGQEDAFRRQLSQSFKYLVKISPEKSYLLVEEQLEGKHEDLLEMISESPLDQFKYLDSLFTEHHSQIQARLEQYLATGDDKERAMMYMRLQTLHLKLLCKNKPHRVLNHIKRIKKNEVHFALEDCYQICKEYEQIEACAILENKLARYFDSVNNYCSLLFKKENFDFVELIKQLEQADESCLEFVPYLQKEQRTQIKDIMQQSIEKTAKDMIIRFDYILRKVMRLCEKESTENYNEETIQKVWYYVLDLLLQTRSDNIQILRALQSADPDRYELLLWRLGSFFQPRIKFTIEQTLVHIELDEFLSHIIRLEDYIDFSELKSYIQEIFAGYQSEALILYNSIRSSMKQKFTSFTKQGQELSSGVCLTQKAFCQECSKDMSAESREFERRKEILKMVRINRFGKGYGQDDDQVIYQALLDKGQMDQIRVYDCGHSFHSKCAQAYALREQLAKDEVACPMCNSEKYRIDFDTSLERRANGRKERQVGVSSSQQLEQEEPQPEEKDEPSQSDFVQVVLPSEKQIFDIALEERLVAYDQDLTKDTIHEL